MQPDGGRFGGAATVRHLEIDRVGALHQACRRKERSITVAGVGGDDDVAGVGAEHLLHVVGG